MPAGLEPVVDRAGGTATDGKEVGLVRSDWRLSRGWDYAALLGLSVFLLTALLTFQDYGITYDEDWNATYGEHIIHWYTSGFSDTSALRYWTLPVQGGFSDVVARLATRVSRLGTFETYHLTVAVFAWFALLGVYRLGRLLGTPFAGLLALLLLWATPRFYGHAFVNLTDIPHATLSLWSLYFLARALPCLPDLPASRWAPLGVCLGLALGVRTTAAVLVAYVGLAFFLWYSAKVWRVGAGASGGLSNPRRTALTVARKLAMVCVLAYGVMLLFWPAAQVRPNVQPVKGLLYATSFGYSFDILFDGRLVSVETLPWYYLLKWFWIGFPEHYVLLGGIALGMAAAGLARTASGGAAVQLERCIALTVLTIAAIFPVAYATLAVPPNYDDVRHFLFILPPLVVLFALAFEEFVRGSAAWFVKAPVVAAVALSMILAASDMVRLHPNQYVYFNRLFAGGMAQAARRYETDYWGNSYKEAVEWLVENYRSPTNGRRARVASCLYSLSTSYFLPPDRFEYLGTYHNGQTIVGTPEVDVFLASPRWGCDKKHSGTVLHTISRMGAPLSYVVEVTPQPPQ